MTIWMKTAGAMLAVAGMASWASLGFSAADSVAPLQLAQLHRAAPNFVGINQWLNSGPLSMASLRGKVVLVDFWTSGCINCIRALPHVTKLHAKYHGKGLVVVGVHTPEFPYERSTATVQSAMKRYGIQYAVAQDNALSTWNAYNNSYWPAQYIIDKRGNIVFEHAGEGAYDEIERTVQKLLNEQG